MKQLPAGLNLVLDTLSRLVKSSVVSSVTDETGLTCRPGNEGDNTAEAAGLSDFTASSQQCRRNRILLSAFKEGLAYSFKELQNDLPLVSLVLTQGAVCCPSLFPTN